jgi:hypothetical protein
MSRNIAGDIESEYGPIDFKNPSIEFGYNIITLKNKKGFLEIFFLVLMIGSVFLVVYYDKLIPFSVIYIALVTVSLIYFVNRNPLAEIDFLRKEIRLTGQIPIIGRLREKFLKKPPVLAFDEIIAFENVVRRTSLPFGPRFLFSEGERRNLLVVRSFDHSPVTLAEFRFERDSRRLGELLQFYVKDRSREKAWKTSPE